MAAFSGMIFELMKGRRCSVLQSDLPQPLCAAISSAGGGMVDQDAVTVEIEDCVGEIARKPRFAAEKVREGSSKAK